jgi:phenylacetate-coenzyme A ligase PaaK-like adenylate-forming protein
VPTYDACSCGRVLPVFGVVAGRAQDVLRSASGDAIGPRQVIDAMRPAMDGVVDFQAIQDADGRLRVLVVQRDSPPPEATRERIAAIFEQLVQPPEAPQVERVDHIALTPGGKLRTLVSADQS